MAVGLEAMMRAAAKPCRVEASLHTKPTMEGSLWRRSYLRCDWLPFSHIEYCFGAHFDNIAVPASRADDYRYCLQWRNGFPDGARELVDLLSEALVVPPRHDRRIDLAVALDWYKILDPAVSSDQWENTVVGDLIWKMKYWKDAGTRRAAADRLVAMLAAAVSRHPALRGAPYVVSVPGSAGDGNSVGEYIARHVADQTGKSLIQTIGPAREARKGGGSLDALDGRFHLPTSLHHPCIVVDDVYRSGVTMRATALAARQAGAPSVFGLAAAKTISG